MRKATDLVKARGRAGIMSVQSSKEVAPRVYTKRKIVNGLNYCNKSSATLSISSAARHWFRRYTSHWLQPCFIEFQQNQQILDALEAKIDLRTRQGLEETEYVRCTRY